MPELLAPAGGPEKLRTALAYGADAVYLGGPGLNLRAPGAGFSWEELPLAIDLAHRRRARAYFALNAFPSQGDLCGVREYIERLRDLPPHQSPDGIIVADPGVFQLVRRELPDLPVHVSTQANTLNIESVRFWSSLGARRVNLARELDRRAIGRIAADRPEVELEVFCHGAMCLALSGRCSLSAYLNDRPANLGLCTHPCRYEYRPVGLALEEATRPGEILWETFEANGHTAFLSPDDLCLVKYLGWLARAGIDSVKIEGRMKSAGYLAQVVDVYRTALDDLAHGRCRAQLYLAELRNSATRDLTTGFFLKRRMNYGGRNEARKPVLARIVAREGQDTWRVAVRSPWNASRDGVVLQPGLRRPLLSAGTYGLENDEGITLPLVHSGQEALLRSDSPELAEDLFIRLA